MKCVIQGVIRGVLFRLNYLYNNYSAKIYCNKLLIINKNVLKFKNLFIFAMW